MKLTDEENSAESGIDVVASPRQALAERSVALRRREGAHRVSPVGWHLPIRAQPFISTKSSHFDEANIR